MAANNSSINIRDHGVALDDKKKRVQCNYCSKVVSGFHRLKCHLGGVQGDVAPCGEVPGDVKEEFRNKLFEVKRENLTREVGELSHSDLPLKRNWCPSSSSGSGSEMQVRRDSTSAPLVREHVLLPNTRADVEIAADSKEWQVQKRIGRFFYENEIDFSVASSPSFKRMIHFNFSTHGQLEYKIPSCQELKGWILEEEVKEMHEHVKKIRESWASTGCSILLDDWFDEKGRNLVNIFVDCQQGPIYLQSFDISDDFVGDVDALLLLLDGVIEEVGVENVVQVIASSATERVKAVAEKFLERHKTVFWGVSASYCIGLMLDNMATMDSIRDVLDKAKTITQFIHGHASVLNLFRNYSSGHDLVKPSKIRSAMAFLTLENIVEERENLEKMFASSAYNNLFWTSRMEAKRVADLVRGHSFWEGADSAIAAAMPLVHVLGLIYGNDKPFLGFIYETMDQAKETIREQLKRTKSKFPHMPFWEEIDRVWNNYLHNPLHAAGYYLNPSLFYANGFHIDPEVSNGLTTCIIRMVRNQQTQDSISQQLDKYRHAKGAFEEGSAYHRRNNIPPALWWSQYGGHCPELQRFAIRVLSQTCDGVVRFSLKRSLAEKLLTKGNNSIEQQQLRDLAFVHYNLQLRQYSQSGTEGDIVAEEIDPMDDWVVDDAEKIMYQNDDSTWMDLDGSDMADEGEGPSRARAKKKPR